MNACEEYGPLLSAMLDGEISPHERAAVDAHLNDCPACRHRAARFAELDRLATHDVPPLSPARQAEIHDHVRRRLRKRRLSWTATYAAAAILLIAMVGAVQKFRTSGPPAGDLGAALAQPTPRADDNPLAGPLETLQVVSRQEQRTYDSMRRLMGLDLRALKLELKHLELAPEQIEPLSQRIDVLIRRVEAAGSDEPLSETGESI